MLEWGLPPLAVMMLAGRTSEPAKLQSALGYARVYYNVTTLMVLSIESSRVRCSYLLSLPALV